MKIVLASAFLLLSLPLPALAQAVESAPLSPLNMPTYTQDVKKPPEGSGGGFRKMEPIANPAEVDAQAARDAANAPPEKEIAPATPPPGPDSLPAQADAAPATAPEPAAAGGAGEDRVSVSPAGDARPPAPVGEPPQRGPSFRNGATPADEDMSSRVFCTLKVSFTADADAKTYDAVKSYVDANTSTIALRSVKPSKGAAQDLCLMIDQHNLRAKTYKDLKKLLPLRTRAGSGVTLSGEGFTPVSTRD